MKRKVSHEAYFTSPKLAAICVERVASLYSLNDFDLVVEPSAGTGSFFDLLPPANRLGIDISSSRPDIERFDFLRWTPPAGDHRIMTIGNPPFGARGSHAIQFMNHAATFSDVIAFILPRSFKKDTFYNRVNPYFHLTSSFDDHEYFRESDRSAQIKTVFQIWQRESDRRGKIARPRSHADFTMRHAHLSRVSEGALRQLRSQYEFTIPQVGSNFFPRDVHSVKRGSHWFIHPLQPGVREVFQKCDFSFLDDMNTAHKSLSKADIVQAYRSAKGDREC